MGKVIGKIFQEKEVKKQSEKEEVKKPISNKDKENAKTEKVEVKS